MNYQEAWTYLDNLQFHKIKLGLDSMRDFLAKVGGPEKGLRVVHVAGTNGKGSVCATLLTLLGEAGYRVGLYTSPHLSSVRERFRINDEYISEQEFAELATRIKQSLGNKKITYFEFTTAIALLWFSKSDLDLVILETGLGGRLDATNVITPLISVITNVSMDHEAYLGDTLEAVSHEKAGIIKENVPVVSGVADDVSREVVKKVCLEKSAPLYLYGDHFTTEDEGKNRYFFKFTDEQLGVVTIKNLQCSMKGDYQRTNAALAIAVVKLLGQHDINVREGDIRRGLLSVRWPGRLEHITLDRQPGISYLLDGAHNPAGVDSLVRTLENEYQYKNLVLVWGAMADKDLSATLPMMAKLADRIILTRPKGERTAEPEALLEMMAPGLRRNCEVVRDVKDALERAAELAEPGDMIVIAGSLYLVGATRKILLGELVS